MNKQIERQLAAVQQEMESRPAGLLNHVRRVADEAGALARYWDVDPQRVALASWGHDLFRHLPPAQQLEHARQVGIKPDEDDERSPIVLHGPIAAAVLRDRFRVVDDDVLEAIEAHTLGIPHMTQIAKIILIADKVEPGKRRNRPSMGAIRHVARRDLDLALLCWSDWSWIEAVAHGWKSHPGHWIAREDWVAQHHYDIAMPGLLTDEEFEAVR
jgi:predicted HD superfamily hydrolase involved in NAD metabolism